MNQPTQRENVLAELERLCQEIAAAQDEFLASVHELSLSRVTGAIANPAPTAA